MNGTVKATLGICDGLHAARGGADMTLWVTAAAADYHELERRYAGWRIITSPPADRFGAALRLSQPSQLTEALDLHALAPVNVFVILDTIAWDVVYPELGEREKTWRYLAAYADGLLFISEFSRQRFQARFALSPPVRSRVVHLSLDPADYASHVGHSVASDPVLAHCRQLIRPQVPHTDTRPDHPRVSREETDRGRRKRAQTRTVRHPARKRPDG